MPIHKVRAEQIGSGLDPIGSVLFSVSSTAPTSYVLANGAVVANATYPLLNNVVTAASGLRISGDVWVIDKINAVSAPAGTTYAASSNIDAPRTADKAFDGSLDSYSGCWHSSGGPPQWIRLTFSTPRQLNKWQWQRRAEPFSTSNYPTDWTLSGSNDGGVTKTLLYTATNDGGQATGTWNVHQFTNSNSYTTYQMDITASATNAYVIIGEIRVGANGDSTSYYLPNYTGLPTGVYAYIKAQ